MTCYYSSRTGTVCTRTASQVHVMLVNGRMCVWGGGGGGVGVGVGVWV